MNVRSAPMPPTTSILNITVCTITPIRYATQKRTTKAMVETDRTNLHFRQKWILAAFNRGGTNFAKGNAEFNLYGMEGRSGA